MRRGGKGSIPIPAALANLILLSSPSSSSASVPVSSFQTISKAGERLGVGAVVGGRRSVVTGGG